MQLQTNEIEKASAKMKHTLQQVKNEANYATANT